jgi:hypothetical protein
MYHDDGSGELAFTTQAKQLCDALTIECDPAHPTAAVQTQAIVETWDRDNVCEWAMLVLSCSPEHVAGVWLEGTQLVGLTPAEIYEEILGALGEANARIIEDAVANKLWNLRGFVFRCALNKFLCVAKFYWTEPWVQEETITVLQSVADRVFCPDRPVDCLLAEIVRSEGMDAERMSAEIVEHLMERLSA